jgi:fucose 4-O-acetylase-like acetyltransferase
MVKRGPEERLHALDAVRATALLLGIVLHGTMSYVPGITAMGWPRADSSQSETLQVVFFVVHIFRMTTFFLIAGFFAHLLYHRCGLKEFLRNRQDRVLGPLMLAVLATLASAMQLNPDSNVSQMDSMVRVHTPLVSFSWIHLWFLYILLLLYPLMLMLRYLVVCIDSSGFLRGQCEPVDTRWGYLDQHCEAR